MKSKLIIKKKLIVFGMLIISLLLGFLLFIHYFSSPNAVSRLNNDISKWNGNIATSFDGGTGNSENPFLIKDGETLSYFKEEMESKNNSKYNNKYFMLSNDIDLNNIPFQSIITKNDIKINFDGNGYTIGNVDLVKNNYNSLNCAALFCNLSNSKIENLNIENIKFKSPDNNIYESALIGLSNNNTLENITIINYVLNDSYNANSIGVLSAKSVNTNIKNIYLNGNIDVKDNNIKVGKIYGEINNTKETNIEKIITNVKTTNNKNIGKGLIDDKNIYNYIYKEDKIFISSADNKYTIDEFIKFLNTGTKKLVWQKYNNHLVYEKYLEKPVTMYQLLSNASGNTSNLIDEHPSGIVGSTVYINDFERDWNYYYGKNYTDSLDATLPTMENKNFYNNTNLVKVQITYDGNMYTQNSGTLTGKVSLEELYDKLVYFKYYVVDTNGTASKNDDYIKIELIDTPFTNRPNKKGFNGWSTSYNGAITRYDKEIHTRYAIVPITYTNENPNDINIEFNAIWSNAQVSLLNNNWDSAFSKLYNSEMKEIKWETREVKPFDMSGYFKYGGKANFFESYSGYNERGEQINNETCFTPGGCTYYVSTDNTFYDESIEYYYVRNNRMVQLDPSTLPFEEIIVHNDEYLNENMVGYFKKIKIPNKGNLAGYYNQFAEYQNSGKCNNRKGCFYYQLIQKNDNEIMNRNNIFYFFPTRDTNIIVLNNDINTSWGNNKKPFTLTSIDNNIDYRNKKFNVSNINIECNADTVLENLYIYSTINRKSDTSTGGGFGASSYILGNIHNLKIGRGIKQNSNKVNFDVFIGSNNGNFGSQNEIKRYKLMVESGVYNSGVLTNGSSSSIWGNDKIYVDAIGIYGNDIDRIKNDNNKMIISSALCGSTAGEVNGKDNKAVALTSIYKSGSYGVSKGDSFTGVYIGGKLRGIHNAIRKGIIEGGWFYNLIGGPLTASNREDLNDSLIYVTGGSIDTIVGGAGESETRGNRIIQITGGTVNYSVFGGSNAYLKDTGNYGIVYGSSYIYVGGNAEIGSTQNVQNGTKMYNAEAGSVFGNGIGKVPNTSVGSNDNAYIIIDGNAHIRNSVYAGGNFGAVGVTTKKASSETKIKILGGTIDNSVYGGGNNTGGGATGKETTSYITMENGVVNGSIYGGSNIDGKLYGDTIIKINGGEIKGSVYGGGKGGNTPTSSGTFVTGNTNVSIGKTGVSNTPKINKSVYGGSAFGTVNAESESTNISNKSVIVNIENGIIVESVFGGGQGDSAHVPLVAGPITVNINGGNIGSVYGGCDASGVPNGPVIVNINNGKINSVFGGGNNTGVPITNVNINNGEVNQIFGGSNKNGQVETTNVKFMGGTVNELYGGNNLGGTVNNTNVLINGSKVNSVYGGGNLVNTNLSNISMTSGEVGNIFGGGNQANVNNTKIDITNGKVENIFGGSNQSGNVTKSVINVNNSLAVPQDSYNINNIYGGNNLGGITTNTNINITTGNINSIFGGGNEAVTENNNITVTGGIIHNLYGGGNKAITMNDSKTNITNGTILNSVYGGGNLGNVNGNSVLNIESTKINGSTFGGGRSATVLKNTIVNIGGTTNIGQNVFGGGDLGAIGTNETNNSISTVNLKGGTIGKNVYGGCNTSVVYGKTDVNIGASANTTTVSKNNINIGGTIFGGGEANAEGNEEYDFSFISVTKGIDINIDGTNYSNNNLEFKLFGSIFGSGNASSSAGTSIIYIKNLGSKLSPSNNISIQRANYVTLDNSVMELVGTTDRTNEYSTYLYSINRVDNFKLKNNSTLLVQENANLLKSFTSSVDINGQEVLAEVTINNDTKTFNRNVNNRVYVLANKYLNVTTNETATAYGKVEGMTFFGMYTKYSNGAYQYGLYEESFDSGKQGDAGDVIAGGSYVLGLHAINHDITKNGFYTNYISKDYTTVTSDYIEPTPPDSNYYMWTIGVKAINYQIELMASKYSSLGTYELSLRDFADGDTIFQVIGFNSEGLSQGIELKDSNEVPKLTLNPADANKTIGLSMKSETTEWTSYGTTKFLSQENGKYIGTKEYKTDSQKIAPSLMFYLYHAKNISLDQNLGNVVISLQALTPINEIEYEVKLITITVNINARSFNDEAAYDASITYSKKYEMPSITEVNITNKSQFTAYFSLYNLSNNFEEFYGRNNDNYHALTSNFALPVGTKITMIDKAANTNNPEYYYYIVDENNYNTATNDITQTGETNYRLSNFIKMGSTSNNNTYSDSLNNRKYYNSQYNYVFEEFLFIFDFQDTNITGNKLNNSILFELKTNENRTIVSVLGIRHPIMKYNLYETSNITLLQNVTMPSEYLYSNSDIFIDYKTTVNYDQTTNRQSVINTNYEANNMGLNIVFYDSSGTKISSSLLEDTTVKVDNILYHTDSNGVFRIKLAGKVANLSKKLLLHVGNALPKGTYKIKYKLFASEDGLYSDGSQETISSFNVQLIGSDNAIKVTIPENSEIILDSQISKVLNYKILYRSELTNPNLRMSIFKRNIDNYDSKEYIEIDSSVIFDNKFTQTDGTQYISQTEFEKILTKAPRELNDFKFNTIPNILSGTYKISFKLYNGNYLVDQEDKYFIIKKNINE